MTAICGFHVMVSSSVIPRKLNEITLSISMPFIRRFGIIPVISFWYGWNIMNLVFYISRDNLLMTNHLKTCESFIFSDSSIFDILVGIEYSTVVNKVVSSAYKINLKA